MKKLNRKGFTLIELLAVIVILGILMLTAIPAVTRAITKSRKNTFWQNAKQYIQAAQTPFLSGEYYKVGSDGKATSEVCGTPEPGTAYYIKIGKLELEGGSTTKSSFGAAYSKSGDCEPIVIIANHGETKNQGQDTEETIDKIKWYFMGTDQSKNGIFSPVAEGDLAINKVETSSNATCSRSITDPTNITNLSECTR